MRFPVRVKHRKQEAVIYGKTTAYPFYRVGYRAAGKRFVRSFPTYAAARQEAEAKVRELAEGNQAAALSNREASDALAIRQALEAFSHDTGRAVNALEAVTGYLTATRKLGAFPLTDAVAGFLRTIVTVKRKDIAEAVAEFVAVRKPKAEAKDGKRSQLSPVYAYNVAMWLKEFADTFPATAVCDLTKEHLAAYIGAHGNLSAKSRNDRRAVAKMFLTWCVRQDYLAVHHRLFEADALARETVDTQEIDYYRPAELRDLLAGADADLLPVLVLGGLAGLRVEEITRLDWADVWRVPGHIEITARKAKTRQRRLVETGPALSAWLEPYRAHTGPVWSKSSDSLHEGFTALRNAREIPARRNGLRHAFCTYHFALHANENLTAALAGNSPAMIHQHYKGLATKAEAEKWFAVKPAESAENVIPLSTVLRPPTP